MSKTWGCLQWGVIGSIEVTLTYFLVVVKFLTQVCDSFPDRDYLLVMLYNHSESVELARSRNSTHIVPKTNKFHC